VVEIFFPNVIKDALVDERVPSIAYDNHAMSTTNFGNHGWPMK